MPMRCGSEGCPNDAVGVVVAPAAMDAWTTCETHYRDCVQEVERLYGGGAFATVATVVVLIAKEVAT